MSDFTAAMGGGLDAIYAVLGDSALIVNSDGYRRDCTVIVERDLSRYGDTAEMSGKTAVISVRTSEVRDRPRRGESLTLKETSETYRIDSVIASDELEHRFLAA